MKKDLYGYLLEEIIQAVTPLGIEKYRAKQIVEWIYQGGKNSFLDMTNIPQKQRESLDQCFTILGVTELAAPVSEDGKTTKYLLEYSDGAAVETVLMRQRYGNSVCVSTQAGCAMGCAFCASGLNGFQRNLNSGEILSQILHVNKQLKQQSPTQKIDSIVIMGTGEPLLNYENVLKFIILSHEQYCLNLSYRRFTLSTCGIVAGIERLAAEDIPITLSISLHATDNTTRDKLMPINKKYPIEELLVAGEKYATRTGRRVTYEYILLAGVNDSIEHAEKLANLLARKLANVNLIPVNTASELGFKCPERQTINAFALALEKRHIGVTIRREMGADIQAACGQLRHQIIKK